MFYIDVPPQDYRDPWQSTFEERLAGLRGGQQSVAYFYEKPDNSTFRYRVYNMIQALRNSKSNIRASFFCNEDVDKLRQIVDMADVLVFCRTRYTDKIDQAITLAQSKGKRVFFDIDDYIFDTSHAHLILETLDQDLKHPAVWDTWFAYMSRIGETLKRCDAAITTNPYLAERVTSFARIPANVIPNFLNAEQLEFSEQLFLDKQKKNFARTKDIHLGYFSGTPTHNRDFGLVATALVELLVRRPDVYLLMVGFIELKGELNNFKSRIQIYPLHDFLNLQRMIAHVEINLVPLQNNSFTNCKSELKYFEAAVAGTITIASPTYSYANAITDGQNGYLARSYEWFDKIDYAIAEIGRYPTLAENSAKHAREKYGWHRQHKTIERVLFG